MLPAGSNPVGVEAASWDAVVIGAGPAGSVAARECARRGLATLMVDRTRFPRAKVCGCCLSAAALETMDVVGLGSIPAKLGGRRLTRFELRAGRRAVRIGIPEGVAVSRAALDDALASAARASGVTVLDGTPARVDADGGVSLGHDGRRLYPRVVIVADGLAGRSLDAVPGMSARIRAGSRIGCSAILEDTPVPEQAILMCVARGGYAGLVRLEDGRVNVAAAVGPAFVRAAGGPGRAVSRILASAGVRAELGQAVWRGTPALTRRRRVQHGRVLVVGDSAAYVEPFTGEGMAWAMESGVAVAGVAGRLARGCAANHEWPGVYRRLLAGRHRACHLLALALRSPGVVNVAACAIGVLPALARALVPRPRWGVPA